MNRAMRVVTVSVIAALIGGLLAFAPASAAPAGTVSGTITGPGGAEPAGVSQVRVELLRKTARGWAYRGKKMLDEGDLDFSFPIAEAGTYMVRAKPQAGPYAVSRSRLFKGGPGKEISGATVALKRSAAVAGTVVGVPTGTPKRGAVQLWTRKKKRWAKGRSQPVAADGRFLFAVRPGRYRVLYRHLEGRYWAPTSKAVTVRGRKTVSGVDIAVRPSRTVSGALTRVGFTGDSHVSAEVRAESGWGVINHDYRARDTYTIFVPGPRPRVRVVVWGDGPIWGDGPKADHPTIYWDGSDTGVLAGKRAKTIDLGQGSVAGVDITLHPFRDFETTTPLRVVGKPKVGKTLKAAGAWSPKPTRVRYQWHRGGARIDGATGRTYRLRQADRGRKVWVSARVERGWFRPLALRSSRIPVR